MMELRILEDNYSGTLQFREGHGQKWVTVKVMSATDALIDDLADGTDHLDNHPLRTERDKQWLLDAVTKKLSDQTKTPPE